MRRIKYGDTSLIVSLFSRKSGKFSAIAKGVRSSKSKSIAPAALEPLTWIEAIEYFKPTRTIQLLSATEIIDDYHNIKANIEKFDAAIKFIKSIDELVPENEPYEKIFQLLVDSLKELQREDCRISLIELFFKAHLLDALGDSPAVNRCQKCGAVLWSRARYLSAEGGMLCPNCAQNGIPLNSDEIEALSLLFSANEFSSIKNISPKTVEKVRTVLELHLKYHAGRG